jgi:hypothetical protein
MTLSIQSHFPKFFRPLKVNSKIPIKVGIARPWKMTLGGWFPGPGKSSSVIWTFSVSHLPE